MAVFSVNQATHFYVAKSKVDDVNKTSALGAIAIKKDQDGCVYIKHKGFGGVSRTDLIDPKNVMHINLATADSLVPKYKKVTVKLNSAVGIVPGQDYVLNAEIRQYIGMSDENIYTKYGVVHATANMNASQFYEQMAISLVSNFKRDIYPLFVIELVGATKDIAGVKVDKNGTRSLIDASGAKITGTFTGLTISEAAQEWSLGIKQQVPVLFDIMSSTINKDGEEVVWGDVAESVQKVTNAKYGSINNGKRIADLEYFHMGERGDQYRKIGWPDYINTQYMVDATQGYNVLNVHYSFVGSNESVQKSEKDLMVVSTDATILAAIKSAITGEEVPTVVEVDDTTNEEIL